MSDTESHQASIDASEASIPAENGPREVANDPPPLGSAEERENEQTEPFVTSFFSRGITPFCQTQDWVSFRESSPVSVFLKVNEVHPFLGNETSRFLCQDTF